MTWRSTTMDEWDDALSDFEQSRGEGVGRLLRSGNPEVAYERREFLERQPWRVFSAQVEQRIARERTERRLKWTMWFAGLGFALSAAVALFVFAGPTTSSLQPAGTPPEIRMKGATVGTPLDAAATLRVVVDGHALIDGAPVSAGAELTFSVDTVGYDHVFVFGEEQSGARTAYYPDDVAARSILVGEGKGHTLPDSVLLDDAIGRECMVAVFSRAPLAWAEVQAIVAGAPGATEGVETTRVCFEKQR